MRQQQLFFMVVFVGEVYGMLPATDLMHHHPISVSTSLDSISEYDELTGYADLPGQVPQDRSAHRPMSYVERNLKMPIFEEEEHLCRGQFSAPSTPRGRSLCSSVVSISRNRSACFSDKEHRLDDLQKQITKLQSELSSLSGQIAETLRLRGAVENLDERFLSHIVNCEGTMVAFLKLHEDSKCDPLEQAHLQVQSAQRLNELDSSLKYLDQEVKIIRGDLRCCKDKCDGCAEQSDNVPNVVKTIVAAAVEERVNPLVEHIGKLGAEVKSLQERRGWFKRLFVCCYPQAQYKN